MNIKRSVLALSLLIGGAFLGFGVWVNAQEGGILTTQLFGRDAIVDTKTTFDYQDDDLINPRDEVLETSPLTGKITTDRLTAQEYNRILELTGKIGSGETTGGGNDEECSWEGWSVIGNIEAFCYNGYIIGYWDPAGGTPKPSDIILINNYNNNPEGKPYCDWTGWKVISGTLEAYCDPTTNELLGYWDTSRGAKPIIPPIPSEWQGEGRQPGCNWEGWATYGDPDNGDDTDDLKVYCSDNKVIGIWRYKLESAPPINNIYIWDWVINNNGNGGGSGSVETGVVSDGDVLTPISGYTKDQCHAMVSINNLAHSDGDSYSDNGNRHIRSRLLSNWEVDCERFDSYNGSRSGSSVTSGTCNYMMICGSVGGGDSGTGSRGGSNFGGTYSQQSGGSCDTPNPLTGDCSCPDGFQDQELANGISGEEQYLHVCWSGSGASSVSGGGTTVTDLITPNYTTGYSSYTGPTDVSEYDFIEFGGFDSISGTQWTGSNLGTASTMVVVSPGSRGAANLSSEVREGQIDIEISEDLELSVFIRSGNNTPRLAFVRGIKVGGGSGTGSGGALPTCSNGEVLQSNGTDWECVSGGDGLNTSKLAPEGWADFLVCSPSNIGTTGQRDNIAMTYESELLGQVRYSITTNTFISFDKTTGDVAESDFGAGSINCGDNYNDPNFKKINIGGGGSGGASPLPICANEDIMIYSTTSSEWECAQGNTGVSLANLSCPDGEYMAGFDSAAQLVCKPLDQGRPNGYRHTSFSSFNGCAGSGATALEIQVVGNDLVLSTPDIRADYRWKGSLTSDTATMPITSDTDLVINYAYGRDDTQFRLTTTGDLEGRCKGGARAWEIVKDNAVCAADKTFNGEKCE